MKTIKKKLDPVLILNVIGILFFTLLLRWNNFNTPFIRDEGEYAYSAWILKQGLTPYLNSFIQKPPMIIYTYYLSQLVNPSSFWSPRILAYIFLGLTILFWWLIIKKEFGKKTAWIAAWFMTPMFVLPNLDQFTANTEMFLVLPLTLFVYLYFLKKEKASLTIWFIAGILASISLLYKPTIIPILAYIFIFWVIYTYKKQTKLSETVAKILIFIIGVSVTTLIILVPFLNPIKFQKLKEVMVFDLYYANLIRNSLGEIFKYFFSSWWPVFVLFFYFLYKRPKNYLFYLGLLFATLLSTGGSVYGHYYIPVIPILTTISAVSLENISHDISIRFKRSNLAVTILLTGLVILFISKSSLVFTTLSPEQFSAQKFGDNPFNESVFIANKIDNLTKPKDYILVAGSEPQILYYAKRLSSTRFVIFYPLMISTPFAEKFQKEAIDNIGKNKPSLIVFANTNYSWLRNENSPPYIISYLDDLIKNEYHLFGVYAGNGYPKIWIENPTQADLVNVSLALYVRK